MIEYVPHIALLLGALRVNRERLAGRSKIAIDARLLRALLQALAETLPFSGEFYLQTYPDIAEARAAGQIADLRRHFVEVGYFEGRVGAPPPVDETYYTALYLDIGAAIRRGEIRSAAEHYVRAGASEGRIPCPRLKGTVESWMSVLRGESAHG